MRILHIIDSGGLYGAEMMLLTLAKEQSKQGLDPVIASIGIPGCDEKYIEVSCRNNNLTVKQIRIHPGPNFIGALKIIDYAKQANFDIIHSHGYKGNILIGLLPKKIRKIPMLATVHGWTSNSKYSKIKLYQLLDRFSLRFLDAVVVVNKDMLGFPALQRNVKNRIHAINNGISADFQAPIIPRNDIIQFCEGRKVVGAIGRLSSEKGFDVLINAFSKIKIQHDELRLLIIGEGSERKSLEMKIAEHGISEDVYMPGFVEGACHYLSLLKLLVISSLSEGLPITLLEAMREGTPVLASAVGGIPDTLDNGNCGILVPPGDEDKLMATLASSLQQDDYLQRLAEKAKLRFIENYSSERMCNEYGKIYQKLIS